MFHFLHLERGLENNMKKLLLLCLILLTGCSQVSLGAEVFAIEHITAPENNTYKIGQLNYTAELNTNITADDALKYRLDDKYISFKPLSMKWDEQEVKTIQPKIAEVSKDKYLYKDAFGDGIDIDMNFSDRVFQKIVKISSLKDLGSIPKDTKFLEIEFEVNTNMIIDGWNKKDDFEITDTVRLGDYSYIQSAHAWDSYSEKVCNYDEELKEDICETYNNRVKIKSWFTQRDKKLFYKKQIPVDWLKIAQFPIWTDADVAYGTALEFEANSYAFGMRVVKLDTDKFAICYEDESTYIGKCIVGSVSGTTITFGSASTFSNVTGWTVGACSIDTDKLVVVFADFDYGAGDGYARAVTVTYPGGTPTIGTWGDTVEIETGDTEYPACAKLDTDRFVACYNDETNSNTATCVAADVSGTTISPGTPDDIEATDYYPWRGSVEQLATDTFVYCFYSFDADGTQCVVGTVSGTSFSYGSVLEVNSNTNRAGADVAMISSTKFIVTDNVIPGVGDDIMATACTVSSKVITAGTPASIDNTEDEVIPSPIRLASDDTKVLIAYNDDNDSDKGKSKYTTVDWSDRTFIFGNEEIFEVGAIYNKSNNIDGQEISSDKVVICFVDAGDSDKGKCIIGDTPSAAPPAAAKPDIKQNIIWFN